VRRERRERGEQEGAGEESPIHGWAARRLRIHVSSLERMFQDRNFSCGDRIVI
jgi:hypothetical protein